MNDRECLRTPTNVWRSFCDHCDWWRIAFVSPFALYSPLSCEFAANIFFYIRKDIRHSVRAVLRIWNGNNKTEIVSVNVNYSRPTMKRLNVNNLIASTSNVYATELIAYEALCGVTDDSTSATQTKHHIT